MLVRLISWQAGVTQERIRLAAREVFAERGYDKTSVRGIAKVAG
ncbi:TetR family transcriptional regulator, partial [Streptomyces sp. NPDC041003]